MRKEHGFIAAELALGIGLLLFPVAMLVLTLPNWSERQSVARAIARETGRSLVISGSCDHGEADEISNVMARNLGVDPSDVEVSLECSPGRLPRGGELTVRATVRLPGVVIPGIAHVGGWSWTASHVEPVDPYRSFP